MYLQVIPGLSSKSFSSVAPQLQQDQEFDARYVEYFNRSHTLMYFINHSSESSHTCNMINVAAKYWNLQQGWHWWLGGEKRYGWPLCHGPGPWTNVRLSMIPPCSAASCEHLVLPPSYSIVAAALRACRRVNDFSLTTRILEVVRIKCGTREAEIWPYMMQVGSDCRLLKQGWIPSLGAGPCDEGVGNLKPCWDGIWQARAGLAKPLQHSLNFWLDWIPKINDAPHGQIRRKTVLKYCLRIV